MDGSSWDGECITDIFNSRDAAAILNIPISLRKPQDVWIWNSESKGNYTVRSCYRKLIGERLDTRPWQLIWNLQVPPKVKIFSWQLASSILPTGDALRTKHVPCNIFCHMCNAEPESLRHLFMDCQKIIPVWVAMGLSSPHSSQGTTSEWFFASLSTLHDELRCAFVMICWGLWGSRNDRVWKDKAFDRTYVVNMALSYWKNWKEATECNVEQDVIMNAGNTQWRPPAAGRLKLNTDAAFDSGNNLMGMGWVLRDHKGFFLAAKNICLGGRYTVEVAEAMCIREALSWLKETGMGDVDVETDSQLVYYALLSDSFNSAFGFIVDDVKEVASTIHDVDFYFVKRSANRAAHLVAREAVSLSGCGEWLDYPPQFLIDCILAEVMN